ncbi:unnamed protein product [Parnassius apollo]|uniref:(apollo) hypothetical protein n=1 Tax=Parnassius apollo TaxID=110799 RepID=A0A8S3X4K9_PARAO|nr:unnamed protein product [Parnassius apollo]
MEKMCDNLNLNQHVDINIFAFGCAPHILNLLSKDLSVREVKEQVVHVVKYFRNNHFANAKYKKEQGKQLILPQDVRWNTFTDCLESYLAAWPKLIKICEENKENIDRVVAQKLSNIIKRSAEDMLQISKPISVALDRLQASYAILSDTVQCFIELEATFGSNGASAEQINALKMRKNQAITPAHLLAFLIDPTKNNHKLTTEERVSAMDFALKYYQNIGLLPLIIKYEAKSESFTEIMFTEEIKKLILAEDFVDDMQAMTTSITNEQCCNNTEDCLGSTQLAKRRYYTDEELLRYLENSDEEPFSSGSDEEYQPNDEDEDIEESEVITDFIASRIIVADNYYTSLPLAEYLKGRNTDLCGTLRKNKRNLPEEVVKAKLRRGEQIARQKDNLYTVLKWHDKRDVLMISTCHGDGMSNVTTKRGDIMKPDAIIDYNDAKKGIDISDQLASFHSPLRKSLTWYKKIAIDFLFQVAIINARCIYNELADGLKLTVLQVQEHLVRHFLGPVASTTERNQPQKSSISCSSPRSSIASSSNSGHSLQEIPRKAQSPKGAMSN